MSKYVASIDQGTTSTRCMIFNHSGQPIGLHQMEHEQIMPQPGWVEHDPLEIWDRTQDVIKGALASANITAADLAAVGITNQRETTVIWDKNSGKPLHNAIVWMDTRNADVVAQLAENGGQDRFRPQTGLPLATYFSGLKIRWLLDHIPAVREAADKGDALFGNIDTWLLWNLTGGVNGGVHLTDVTNASRTMLMNLDTLSWNEEIAETMGVPMSMLPEIKSSSEVYGYTLESGPFGGKIPLSGILGDQHAATVGQACFSPGEAKNTYGTGCFMILNTGTEIVHSKNGLLSTVCYKFGDQPAVYALEGSIAISGALVQWLRDNLKMIDTAPEVEELAKTVEDNGGIYFVPAFSGLYAPYWRDDARGAIVGLTRFANRGHFARATLEATAFQTREVLDAMNRDSGVALTALKIDGGMVQNELLMQFQADVLDVPVIRPLVAETT
ncbi:MAG: glycerol kinase, partial [Cellvibrionaceae bacterium]